MDGQYDVVIVGGGTAGCVLAHRLSAHPELRVALIEAGPDTPPDHHDPVLWDSYPIVAYFDPRHHWTDLRVRLQPRPEQGPDARPLRRYEQAKVMGGGSSINGMMANRGQPADYDEWAALGAAGWGWTDVLPYFKRLEHDVDFDGPMHGRGGPLPIRRVPRAVWPGFSRAAAEALQAAGLPYIEDQNEHFAPGHFPITINNLYDRRVSAAIAYLDPLTRRRANLSILPRTRARRLLIEGRRATGVEAVDERGAVRTIRGREIVLCAGALHSPAMLLRAGIGPGDHLHQLGIPVVADRPGVGRNLQEHPQIAVSSYLRPGARLPRWQGRHIFVGFRYSSGRDDCCDTDMYGVVVNRGAWHPLGRRLGGFLLWVNKAYSTGQVTLASPDPDLEPEVEFNLLADPRDAQRLMDGLRFLARLYRHPAMRQVAAYPFPTSYSERSRDLAVVTWENWLRTAPIGWLLDRPAPVRRMVMRRRVAGGPWLLSLVRHEDRLEAFVRERVHGTWHACGTCRMGRPSDPLAVVDPNGCVIGVEGLRVADASIMPTIPCANTNLPTIMIAEKLSDAILAGVGRPVATGG
ncbi:MAG: glucose dehydrogenase [Thermomicrobiales bacterium]|nr:MAG: glucose dehydrogenase [Thermomicrobiales bacterium]